MSTPETQEPNSIYLNMDSDAFLQGTSVNSRLSLLGKELYDNIENLILDENILGKAFNKRNLDKKTIYSAYKFKLNLDELNSDSASVENVLIEEKNREILFKGEEDEEEKEKIEEEKKEVKVEKRMNEEELFGDIEKNIDDNIKKMQEKKNKVKNKEELDDEFDKFLQEGNTDNNNDAAINNNTVNNNNVKVERFDSSANLFQDLSYYEQEYNEQNKPSILEDNPNPPKTQEVKETSKQNKDMENIFDILSDEEKDKEEEIKNKKLLEEKSKLDKNQKEKEIEKEAEKEKKKDILKEEYYPIDVIEEGEKYYNLSNESKEDLYPLNTYQINNGLCIEFLKYQDPNITTALPDTITTIGSDNDNNLYICTNNGKIIKKTRKAEILMQNEKYNESISCIDIVDLIAVTGDENGNIVIWYNNTFNQILTNVNGDNTKIICIKIIEIINTQLTFIFTDIKGNFNLIKINNISKHNGEIKNEELEYEFSPIYKILLFPNNVSFIKTQKPNITLILVSPQNIGIYRLSFENNIILEKLKLFDYTYGEKGKFFFDVSAGFGFPPVSDLNKGKLGFENPAAAYRRSISSNIVIGKEEENSMITISYGVVLQLFGFRVSEDNKIFFKPIGFIINDRPILRNCFITNSMIALLSDNFHIKLINTYDFVPKVYNQQTDVNITKDFLISYESLNIKNSGLIWDTIDFSLENKNIRKNIFNNKIISNDFSLYFIANEGNNLQKIVLSNYDDVLNSLCEKEDYIRMLWLLSIILNKKTNLLNKQLNKIERNYSQNNKKKLLDLYLMRFFVTKTIPELQNNNEIYARMLLEFFIETDTFSTLSQFLDLLTGSGLDKYIFTNLTKYIANGNLSEIVLNQDILKRYIEFCLSQNEKLLLNKVLLKLNLDTLLQKDILKIISENELINPYIYTRIKNIQQGKTDYFLPVMYLDSVFKKEYLEKKNEELIKQNLTKEQLELYNLQLAEKKELMKDEIKKNLNISEDYKKLIREHNMEYFNEDTFTCHEYIGHKFLWYCNKCISGKEYPNDTPMSHNKFKETAIKILAYLINDENMKLYLEFDSYTYFHIISKFFLDANLLRFITGIDSNYSKAEKAGINEFLGENASEEFNAFYVYTKIKEGLKDILINRYFLKYDFYVMTCEICEKVRDFVFDKKDVMDTLIYFSDLDINEYNEEKDIYNCHRKLENQKEINKFKDKIEQYMINLLDYLKSYNLLTEEYCKVLLKKRRISGYKKLYFYLCEETREYKECLELKLLDYEKNKDTFSKKEKKELFDWIKKIHDYTKYLEVSPKNTIGKEYHKDFKRLLLQYLNQLCRISIEELSKLIDECYDDNDEREELIRHLGEGQSSALQLKYLDEYFKLNARDMNENIDKYMNYLEMEIDILIKDHNKKRIKKLLMDYKVLCNEKIFKKLKANKINESCIYICQFQGKVKEGVEITIKEVEQKYRNIITVLDKPNYNPIIIDIELNEMYKYFELGLSVCQNNFLEEEKEEKEIDESWLDLFNKACEFKIDFYPRYENNKNNIKTREHKKIFNGLQNCIQLILGTMSDYISLNLLVEIIAKNCEKWKTIEFYTFLDKSFYSFRRSEQILKCGKNLMSTSVLIQYDDIRELRTLGKNLFLSEEKCNFCKFSLKNSVNESFWMFACGHKYHIGCTKLEEGQKICYVCRMNEIKGDEEKVKQLKEAKNIVIEKENNEEEEDEDAAEKKKKELMEKERRMNNKKKLNALKKLKKKRREIDTFLRSSDLYN